MKPLLMLLIVLNGVLFFAVGYTIGAHTAQNQVKPPLKSSYFIWTDEHGTHRLDTSKRKVLISGDNGDLDGVETYTEQL
jgi:hypothetical protein